MPTGPTPSIPPTRQTPTAPTASDPPGALERCVGDLETFLAGHFGRRPHLSRHPAGAFDDLLSVEDIDRLLTGSGLRIPALRLVRGGQPVPSRRYTTSARIANVPMPGIAAPRRLLAEYDAGATVVLQGLHRYWMPLRRFCRDLELTLGHPCQVNAYLTPAGAQGLALHHDGHDVFVLQLFGRKQWEVHAGEDAAENEPWDLVLEPGDALYLPAGTKHAARTQAEASGHLTVGVLSATWRGLLERAVATALEDPRFDAALPAGWLDDTGRFADVLRRQLDALADRLTKTDTNEIADEEADDFRRHRHPLLAGAFAARLVLDRIDQDSVVRGLEGSVTGVRTSGDRVALLIGDVELRMPARAFPAVRRLLDGGDHRVQDLPGLDAPGRLVLARRLVREGVLEVR
jgi:hypothetical protein